MVDVGPEGEEVEELEAADEAEASAQADRSAEGSCKSFVVIRRVPSSFYSRSFTSGAYNEWFQVYIIRVIIWEKI